MDECMTGVQREPWEDRGDEPHWLGKDSGGDRWDGRLHGGGGVGTEPQGLV